MSPLKPAMAQGDGSGVSREQFATVLAPLDAAGAAALSRAELETRLWSTALSLFRQLFQDHLALRACREQRVPFLAPTTCPAPGSKATRPVYW